MTIGTAIRTAQAHEAGAVAQLHLRTALHAYMDIFPPEAPPPTAEELTEQWSAWLGDERHRGFVAEETDAVVGVVLAGPDPVDEDLGHLSRLYVDPAMWGRGIGRALYDACVAELAARGFEIATLWVLERNERVRGWYERLGWNLTGERKPVYAPARIDDVRYRLLLSPSSVGPE
jgi:ribosomal protein S18 acetylase RimI-like enzyme